MMSEMANLALGFEAKGFLGWRVCVLLRRLLFFVSIDIKCSFDALSPISVFDLSPNFRSLHLLGNFFGTVLRFDVNPVNCFGTFL